MLAAFEWLKPRRRADTASVRRRIEPTLPDPLAPASGMVRLRVRYNDSFAVAVTEQEAALHGISTDYSWSDAYRDDASREIILDVPVPRFAQPAPTPIDVEPVPVATPPVDDRRATDAVPTPTRPMQPTPPTPRAMQVTLSPEEHAERLLAWCQHNDHVGEVVIYDMERAYAAMCAEDGLRPRAWNPISRELTLLLHGRCLKTYAISKEPDGAHRRRVFRIPPAIQPVRAAA